ncbi:MAG: General secretion pathway protein A [Nitrospira sp.]|nr:MAG: General secretion pathway protein A [Nitrospira sp.]
MYNTFYHLHSKPFALLPDADFLYLGKTHRTAYSLLEYGLLNEAPFIVLTGDPGMGKTSLLQKVMAEHRNAYSIGLVTNVRYDVDYLLPWILQALGLSHTQLDPIESHRLFTQFLAQEAAGNRRVVLIMDEAQHLGVTLLEELRLLSNLNQNKTLQLQIILSGQPNLHALLRGIDMTQFAQRVVVDYHLQPFTEEEVMQYIAHRLRLAGATGSLFTRQACSLAFRLSQGNPRLINQICEMALTYGFAKQASRITAKLLAQAALDRRKSRILPLCEEEDLSVLAITSEDAEEPITHDAAKAPEAPAAAHSVMPTASLTSTLAASSQAEDYYQRGLVLRKSRDFTAALEPLEKAAMDPAYHVRAFGQMGLCYRAMGQPSRAVAAFRKACADQRAPRRQSLSVRYLLGRTLEQLGERPEALEQYRLIFRTDRTFKDTAARLSHLEQAVLVGFTQHRSRPSRIGQAWKQMRQLLKRNS